MKTSWVKIATSVVKLIAAKIHKITTATARKKLLIMTIKMTPDEPEWLRRTLLQTCGTELRAAAGYTILAINGEGISAIEHNTMQQGEKVNYYFHIVSEDVQNFNITANDIFYRDLATRLVRYDVKCVAQDSYGWVRLDCIEKLESTVPTTTTTIMPPNITYPKMPIP